MVRRRGKLDELYMTDGSTRSGGGCPSGSRISAIVRKTIPLLAACLLLGPGGAGALGLGGLELSSNLNQPLEAHIPLRSVAPGDLDDLQIRLASREHFQRAGLDRPFVLTRLRFEVIDAGQGESFVRVTTKDPVREPFLNFLLEANWPQGRVIREYTVLLDPPVYGAAISSGVQEAVTTAADLPPLDEGASPASQQPARAAAEAPEPAQAPQMKQSAPEETRAAAEVMAEPEREGSATQASSQALGADDLAARDAPAPESMAAAPTGTGVEEEIGPAPDDVSEAPADGAERMADTADVQAPSEELASAGFQPSPGPGTYEVQRGDTLWSLAERRRPRDSVSIQQTMLAILAANRGAFAEANVNSLRAGAVLQLPDLHDIAVSKEEALAEVRRQNALWDEYRRAVTTQVAQAPQGLAATGGDTGGDDSLGEEVSASDTDGDDAVAAADNASEPEDGEAARLQVLATGSAVEQPEGAAQSGGERLQGLRNELNLTLEEMDAVRQENEELRVRLDQTEALVEDLKRLIELKDDNIATLQRRLGDLGEETRVPDTAFTPEPEPADEGPVEPETVLGESPPQEAPPAASNEPQAVDEPGRQEPGSTTTNAAPSESPSVATVQESSGTEASGNDQGKPSSNGGPGIDETTAVSGKEPPPAAEATPPAQEDPAAASASKTPGDPDSTTEKVAMVGETGSSGAASSAKSSPKAKPPAAPSYLESVLATLASLTGTVVAFGKSVGSVVASFIGSARESVPALPALPSALPVDPVMLGAAGGGVLLLGAGWVVMRRRRADEAEAVEVELGLEDEVSDFAAAPAAKADIGSENESPPVGEGLLGDEATGIVAAEADDDPLAEVNVYMAYERFDQAEALVRDAIERYPDRHDYKLKLLEVAYAAKNLEAFEEGARNLESAVGPDSTLMKKAVSWWNELSPDRELFAASSAAAASAAEEGADDGTSDINRIFDVTAEEVDSGAETQADERRSTNTDVDFDIGDEEAAASDTDADEVSGGDLDFDLGSVDPDEETGDLDFSLSDDEQSATDPGDPAMPGESFSLDEGTIGGSSEATGAEAATDASSEDNSLDFDLSGVDLPQDSAESADSVATEAGDEWSGRADDGGFDLELDDDDTALGSDDSEEAEGAPAGGESEAEPLDFELEATIPQAGQSLDFGLGGDDGEGATATESEAGEAGGGEGEDFDLSLEAGDPESEDMDQFDTVKLDDAQLEEAGDDSGGDDSDLSLDLSESDEFGGYGEFDETDESAGEPPSQSAEAQGEDFDLDLSGFDMEAEGSGDDAGQAAGATAGAMAADDDDGEKTQFMLRDPGQGSEAGSGAPFNEMSGDTDAIQTKLDLALAYIDMGDADGARSILDEVMVEGNDTQKKAAEELLTKLD